MSIDPSTLNLTGWWKSIDDSQHEPKTVGEIWELIVNGVTSARVVLVLQIEFEKDMEYLTKVMILDHVSYYCLYPIGSTQYQNIAPFIPKNENKKSNLEWKKLV